MSLLTYASPWKSDTSTDNSAHQPSRRRIPSIGKDSSSGPNPRKTVKVRPTYGSVDQYESYQEDGPTKRPGPNTIDQLKETQTEKNTRVNSILNRITSFSNDDRLGDFNPMPYPTLEIRVQTYHQNHKTSTGSRALHHRSS